MIQRRVIDSNMLRDVNLEKYLSLCERNYAVLCDYVIMEAYKAQNPVEGIFSSMDILSRYPQQVIILKNTPNICGISARSAGLQKRLICQTQTAEFKKFCKKIKNEEIKNLGLLNSIYEHSRAAREHLNLLEHEYKALPKKFYEFEADFSSKELQIIRTNGSYTTDLLLKIIKIVMELSAYVFAKHPNVKRLPDFYNLPNTYIFRNSLFHYITILEWMSYGGLRAKKSAKMRNDIIDIYIMTYGSFFDGLMTNEKKMLNRYRIGKKIIDSLSDIKKF
jgi:hypothetical protein